MENVTLYQSLLPSNRKQVTWLVVTTERRHHIGRAICRQSLGRVALVAASALWKNGGSDPDAV